MIISIGGFMGSGKTTFCRKLAQNGAEVIDLDDFIETKLSKIYGAKQLGEHIRALGWEKFRTQESEAVAELIAKGGETIIALGGGTLERNLDLIKSETSLFWLDTPFEVCFDRISGDTNRPLVNDKESLEKLFNDRLVQYQQAHHSLNIEEQEKIQMRDELVNIINSKD